MSTHDRNPARRRVTSKAWTKVLVVVVSALGTALITYVGGLPASSQCGPPAGYVPAPAARTR